MVNMRLMIMVLRFNDNDGGDKCGNIGDGGNDDDGGGCSDAGNNDYNDDDNDVSDMMIMIMMINQIRRR